jgi:hypothetical protein
MTPERLERVHKLLAQPNGRWLAVSETPGRTTVWEAAVEYTPLAFLQGPHLNWEEKVPLHVSDPREKRSCLLLRHKLRFDVQIEKVPERVLPQFDIEVSATTS